MFGVLFYELDFTEWLLILYFDSLIKFMVFCFRSSYLRKYEDLILAIFINSNMNKISDYKPKLKVYTKGHFFFLGIYCQKKKRKKLLMPKVYH